jgi:hypothetical protein
VSTLGQLKTSVDAWLARDDVAVTGSDFTEILLISESEIARDFRFAIQEAKATLTFTGRSQDLPDDFLEARNPFIDDNIRRIEYQTPQAIREGRAWEDSRAGQFFTLEGNNASPLLAGATFQMTITGPGTVADPVDIDINYWARFPALTADPDTNWILVNHFDIYLYATLRVACEYIQEDVLEDRYAAKYDRVIEKQNKHENRKRFGGFPKQAYGNPRGVI